MNKIQTISKKLVISFIIILIFLESAYAYDTGQKQQPLINSYSINFNSVPEGAAVLMNNEYKGETPVDIIFDPRNPGYYDFEFIKEGYKTYRVTYYISGPVAMPPVILISTIELKISSDPQGAEIWMDNTDEGMSTPAYIYLDKPGYHYFELYRNGYQPYRVTYYISTSETKEVELTPSDSIWDFLRNFFPWK